MNYWRITARTPVWEFKSRDLYRRDALHRDRSMHVSYYLYGSLTADPSERDTLTPGEKHLKT